MSGTNGLHFGGIGYAPFTELNVFIKRVTVFSRPLTDFRMDELRDMTADLHSVADI